MARRRRKPDAFFSVIPSSLVWLLGGVIFGPMIINVLTNGAFRAYQGGVQPFEPFAGDQ